MSYDELVAQMDTYLIRDRGNRISALLWGRNGAIGLPVAEPYAPSPEIYIPLVFIPVAIIRQDLDPALTARIPAEAFTPSGDIRIAGATIVLDFSEDGDQHYLADLSFGTPQPPIVTGAERRDAALTALFRAIAGVEIFDEPNVRRESITDGTFLPGDPVALVDAVNGVGVLTVNTYLGEGILKNLEIGPTGPTVTVTRPGNRDVHLKLDDIRHVVPTDG